MNTDITTYRMHSYDVTKQPDGTWSGEMVDLATKVSLDPTRSNATIIYQLVRWGLLHEDLNEDNCRVGGTDEDIYFTDTRDGRPVLRLAMTHTDRNTL